MGLQAVKTWMFCSYQLPLHSLLTPLACLPLVGWLPAGVRAGGAGGAAAPPVSKIFGQNAKNSGNKETINDGIEK